MPEVELDCGEDNEKVMSGEEEMVDKTMNKTTTEDKRFHEDGMQAAL